MIDDAKDWLRDHAGKVLVCSTGALLALSLFSMGTSLVGDGPAKAEAQAEKLVVQLKNDLGTAQDGLKAKHEKLLMDLPSVEIERADRDAVTGRSILLSFTDFSGSSRDVKQTQALLDARYEFVGPTSRALTEFIPEWMDGTGSSQGVGATYTLRELTIDVSGVQGLDYFYVGVARLDPVAASGSSTAKSEYVVFGFSTERDGTVTSFEAYRASSRTRDVLVAADEEQRPAKAGNRRTPTPSPASRQSDGG
ncbi:hypothetical protein [Saccharopolyspora shandongensis]|uniref:hypothetical protein n=1 Tax=Saccharopolyspora shandongensis TaxID=418495 RepID=UPI0033CF90E3